MRLCRAPHSRKTWHFVGHETSARRLAAVLSILTTCRKMGIEPRRYLRETLAKILAGETDLAALLPDTTPFPIPGSGSSSSPSVAATASNRFVSTAAATARCRCWRPKAFHHKTL